MANNQFTVLQSNVNPATIAEDFVVGELIKMFPGEGPEFYDRIRFHIRQYRQRFSEARFWRLIAGFSDYMLKSYYPMLKGSQYAWNLEEVPLSKLKVRMLAGEAQAILDRHDHNPVEAAKVFREMSPRQQQKIIDPFRLPKDNYPVVAHEEGQEIIVHDGNRRVLNAAIIGLQTIQAYIGRLKEPAGQPAIPESFFPYLFSLLKLSPRLPNAFVTAFTKILIALKTVYLDAPEYVNGYTAQYGLPYAHNQKQKDLLKKALNSD